MRTMRRGVVLFITLSIIAAMLALVGVIFTYLDKSKKNASHTSAIIQADLLYSDGRQAIDGLLKKGSKDKDVKKGILDALYLAPVTLQAKNNENLFTTLECKPMDGGVNINWLALENNSTMQKQYTAAQIVFDKLAETNSIQNPAQLLSMIVNSIDGKSTDNREAKGRLPRKKGIIKLKQLENIARDYRFELDDNSVEKIDWDKYFSFDSELDSKIDGNYISAELFSLLFDVELDAVVEDWAPGADLKDTIANLGGDMSVYDGKLFSTEPIEKMRCRITYGYSDNVYAMGFDYLEGMAKSFEFFGEQ